MREEYNENQKRNCTIHNKRLDSHFTVISNLMIEDPNLSWAAKGLLSYIVSRPNNWNIKTWQLAEIFKGRGGGLKSIWTLIKELKKNGYILYTKSKNLKGQWQHRYDVFPMKFGHFQNMFPHSSLPGMDLPCMEKGCIKTSTELPNTELTKEEHSLPSQKPKTQEQISAVECVNFFLLKVQEVDPNFQLKPARRQNWTADIIAMHREGRSWEEINNLIRISQESEFWASRCNTPANLCKHATTILMQAKHPKNKDNAELEANAKQKIIDDNEQEALQAQKVLPRRYLLYTSEYVEIEHKGRIKPSIKIRYDDKDFRNKLNKAIKTLKEELKE